MKSIDEQAKALRDLKRSGVLDQALRFSKLFEQQSNLYAITGGAQAEALKAITDGAQAEALKAITGGAQAEALKAITGGARAEALKAITGGAQAEALKAISGGVRAEALKAISGGARAEALKAITGGAQGEALKAISGGAQAEALKAISTGAHAEALRAITGGAYTNAFNEGTGSAYARISDVLNNSNKWRRPEIAAAAAARTGNINNRLAEMMTVGYGSKKIAGVMSGEYFAKSALAGLGSVARLFDDEQWDNVELEAINDGSISIDGEVVDLLKINRSIEEIAENSDSVEDFFAQLVAWIESVAGVFKLVTASYVFKEIVLPILIVTVVMNHGNILCWSPQCAGMDPLPAIQKVISQTNYEFSSELLSNYRVVTASSGLIVRSIGNRKGDRIGGLSFGTRVELISKSKNWALIEYYDSELNEYQQGWVFSRYLRKFNQN